MISPNSGLYVVHYARVFDGQNIHYNVKEPTDVSYLFTRVFILEKSIFYDKFTFIHSCVEQLIRGSRRNPLLAIYNSW